MSDARLQWIEDCGAALLESLRSVYRGERPLPGGQTSDLTIAETGMAADSLGGIWRDLIADSTQLASPWMIGHMDTAPHPAAAMTDAVVSALNNNLLFRELSPLASQVEESLITEFAQQLHLPDGTPGLFCSGGSLANLTALFAAVGGYGGTIPRDDILLALPDSGHTSLAKAAAILGFPARNVVKIATDQSGRLRPEDLDAVLGRSRHARKIAVGVLGGTVTGAVDDFSDLGEVTQQHGAWLHIDAIYGGALAYSRHNRHHLTGITKAQSIVLGPQKWLYVPRLSALALFPGAGDFDERLGTPMPYSAGGEAHRGTWGLQGSRRADALTLWVLLKLLGRREIGRLVDEGMERTRRFHALLEAAPATTPLHLPDLNLQVFRLGTADKTGKRLLEVQKQLKENGRGWLSVSPWKGEYVLRAVLLNPETNDAHLEELLADLEKINAA